jgi:hypothetical protein
MDYKIEKAGIYDIPFENYIGQKGLTPTPWLSSSTINIMLNKSPMHAAHAHPDIGGSSDNNSSKVASIGTVAHALILKKADSRIVVSPYPEFRTNEAKAWRDAALQSGKVVVKQSDYDAAIRMADNFERRMKYFDLGETFPTDSTEKTVVAEIEGVWCKIRIDSIGLNLWDLKSTGTEYTPSKWIKNQLYGNGYDVQVELYRRVFKAATGEQKRMILPVLEQSEPHDCYPVILDDLADDLAREKVDWAIKTWRESLAAGKFAGYSDGKIVYARPSAWMMSDWAEYKNNRSVA